MALISEELFAGLRENTQTGNGIFGARRFKVYSTAGERVIPSAVINNPSVSPILPQMNEAFIFNGWELNVASYSVTQSNSPNMVYVEFVYDDFYFTRKEESSSILTEEEYPIYVAEPHIATATLGGNLVERTRWKPETFKYKISQSQIVVTVPIDRWGKSERELVNAQTGKYHKIEGKTYRFIGSNAVYLSRERYEVTYRWMGDAGFNASSLDFGAYTIVKPVKQQAGQPPRFDRLPFEQYIRIPAIAIDTNPTIDFVPAPTAQDINEVNLPYSPGVVIFDA